MAIKTIRTKNIQSHQDVYIELPETGLVVFTGDNSNGKSVITKVLKDLISNSISNVRVRKSDINKECQEGQLEITKYGGTSLLVNLNIEASQTWVRLTRADGDMVTRYLSDKTIPDLVREFGFHYNENRDISLNIADADDSILFFRTSHVTNYDVVDSALRSTDAQTKYEVLKEQYQQAAVMKQAYNENLRVANAARNALVTYDVEKEEELMRKCHIYENILSHFYMPNLLTIKAVPRIQFIDLPQVRLRKVFNPTYIDLPDVKLKGLTKLQAEINDLLKGECPTCHRPFCSCQTSTSETLTSAL